MQTAAFGLFSKLNFSVYGEAVIIMLQNFIIIALIWKYNKDVAFSEIFMLSAFMISYAMLIFDPLGRGTLTEQHWAFITSCSTFMSKWNNWSFHHKLLSHWFFFPSDVIAKLPQIYTIYANKSTGALAFFSFFLNFGGSIARLGTVLMESDDFMFRLQYIVGVVLNTIIIIQFAIYWNAVPVQHKVQPATKRPTNKVEWNTK